MYTRMIDHSSCIINIMKCRAISKNRRQKDLPVKREAGTPPSWGRWRRWTWWRGSTSGTSPSPPPPWSWDRWRAACGAGCGRRGTSGAGGSSAWSCCAAPRGRAWWTACPAAQRSWRWSGSRSGRGSWCWTSWPSEQRWPSPSQRDDRTWGAPRSPCSRCTGIWTQCRSNGTVWYHSDALWRGNTSKCWLVFIKRGYSLFAPFALLKRGPNLLGAWYILYNI